MRVAVLLEDRCQPKKCNDQCHAFCPPVRNGIECIILDDSTGKPLISEPLCIGCGICVNKCPHDALIITNLPEELKDEMSHRYGENGFRLFRMPTPREEQVVGILGQNGMGKSTVLNMLSGSLRPNLGDWTEVPEWSEVIEALPRGELRDYIDEVAEGDITIAVKPQYIDKLPKIFDGKVRELLDQVDTQGEMEKRAEALGLSHLLERNLPQLSGGELQRVALCATLLKDADVYFFDEPSSYLDIFERVRVTKIIQELAASGKRVLVVEHDLAILDVLCDLIHIVYGERAAYGIFTPAKPARTAINTYLDGYLPEQNIRIRDKPIRFLRGRDRGEETGAPILQWGDLTKSLGDFTLHTGEGALHTSEVAGVVGPNGTGKTTLAKLIAGEIDPDSGWVTYDAEISYKPQHVKPNFDGTVRDWLDTELGMKWQSGEFNTTVIRALNVHQLLDLEAKRLSGGELQAVSIALCLGRDADLYLLDEPSAHLDANTRMEAAKAIRRTMESKEKSAMVIDHDIYFIDIVSDSLLVFEGVGGERGEACGPLPLRQGMNRFLQNVGVTFRRDPDSQRPRINKTGSRKDREQKASGEFFYSD